MNEDVVREEANKRVKGTWLQGTPFLEELIKQKSKEPRLDLRDLNELIESLIISVPPGTSKSQLQVELSPRNLLYSYFLLDKLSLSVKAIRRSIFDSKEAPFKTTEEATNWVEQEGQKKPRYLEDANELMIKLQEMTHWSVLSKALPYIGKDGQRRNTVVWAGTLFERLADETKKMARATGFNQDSLVMHILTDVKPYFPLAQIITHIGNYDAPSGETFTTHRVELNIMARDLSTNQLNQLYKEMREKLGIVSDRHIKEDDLKLYETVRRLGYPPEQIKKSRITKRAKGTVDFWKKVKEECEQGEKQIKRTTWNAYRVAYRRLLQRLEDTGIKQVE